jgi:hypothetical protein
VLVVMVNLPVVIVVQAIPIVRHSVLYVIISNQNRLVTVKLIQMVMVKVMELSVYRQAFGGIVVMGHGLTVKQEMMLVERKIMDNVINQLKFVGVNHGLVVV